MNLSQRIKERPGLSITIISLISSMGLLVLAITMGPNHSGAKGNYFFTILVLVTGISSLLVLVTTKTQKDIRKKYQACLLAFMSISYFFIYLGTALSLKINEGYLVYIYINMLTITFASFVVSVIINHNNLKEKK